MNLNNKLILIADSDYLTLKMLDMFFKSAGAKVLLEEECKNVFGLLDQIRPDIIILNMNEVHIDDCEYCKQMKGELSKAAIPTIITSTMPVSKYEEKISSMGAIRYFQKPYSSSHLVDSVREILEIPIMPGQTRTFYSQEQ
ncbi:MAG: response regulator [bacterium]|nr:response regulator [bacterium]